MLFLFCHLLLCLLILFSLDACSTNFKNYTLICRIDSEVQVDSSCSATHHHESGGIFLRLFCSFLVLCLSLLWPYYIFQFVMEVYEMNGGKKNWCKLNKFVYSFIISVFGCLNVVLETFFIYYVIPDTI